MGVYFFTVSLCLFLLVCGTLCTHVCAGTKGLQGPKVAQTIDLFTKEKVGSAKGPNGEAVSEQVTANNFYSSVIMLAGNYFVALAGVNRIDETGKKIINIVTSYTEKGKLLSAEDFSKTKGSWTTQFAVYNKEIEKQDVTKVVKGLLAVAKGDKVHLLSVNYIKKTTGNSPDFDFVFYFVDGIVDTVEPAKKIVWNKSTLTDDVVAGEFKDKFKDAQETDFSLSGSAFLLGEKIVFALNVERAEEKMTVLMQIKDDEGQPEFEYTEFFENCQPHVFPWGNKIMMVSKNCQTDAEKKIMELINIEKAQSDNKEAFFCYYEFLQNKQTFVTIKNETKEILLFTEHTQAAGHPAKTKVNLWMSDGIRLKNIGEIADGADKVSPVNFLFAEGKLFFLNQQLKGDGTQIESVKLTYLEQQSKNIISTINAWSTTDDKILELCKGEEALKILCNTNGLVGFLSGNKEGNTEWKDDYFNVVATVTATKGKAEKIENGFKFSGEGVGAKWLMSEQSKDQPYNFMASGFTLVATVSIGKDTKSKQISILGVSLTENAKVGLWCTTNGKWGVSKNDGQINKHLSVPNCTPEKTYYVALTLNNKKEIFVYVNGRQLSKLNSEDTQITQLQDTAYFYFGADSDTPAKTDVTITNVLLYNWPFEEEKITQLKPKENTVVDTQQPIQPESGETATPGDITTQTATQPDTSATNDKEEETKSLSPPITTEDSAARVGVVGVLCFMLFGVFTLLGRYVY